MAIQTYEEPVHDMSTSPMKFPEKAPPEPIVPMIKGMSPDEAAVLIEHDYVARFANSFDAGQGARHLRNLHLHRSLGVLLCQHRQQDLAQIGDLFARG